jgi:hypothetical protein
MERRGTMRPGGAMVVRTEISRNAAARARRARKAENARNDARTPATRARSALPLAFAPPQRSTLAALDKWPPDGIDQGCRCVWQHDARDGAAAQVGPWLRRHAPDCTCSHPAGARCGHGLCQLRASPARSRAMCLEERRAPRMRAPRIRRQDPVPPRPTGRQAAQRRGQCQPGGF